MAENRAALQEAQNRSRAALQAAEKAMMEVANLSEESLKEALEVRNLLPFFFLEGCFFWGLGRIFWKMMGIYSLQDVFSNVVSVVGVVFFWVLSG